jgi:hypothetical protein
MLSLPFPSATAPSPKCRSAAPLGFWPPIITLTDRQLLALHGRSVQEDLAVASGQLLAFCVKKRTFSSRSSIFTRQQRDCASRYSEFRLCDTRVATGIEKRTPVELQTGGLTNARIAPAKARHCKGGATLRHLAAGRTSRRDQSALIRVARRDSFRATVFRWSTPLVIARCSSG